MYTDFFVKMFESCSLTEQQAAQDKQNKLNFQTEKIRLAVDWIIKGNRIYFSQDNFFELSLIHHVIKILEEKDNEKKYTIERSAIYDEQPSYYAGDLAELKGIYISRKKI